MPSSANHDASSSKPVFSLAWWVRDKNGVLTLAQWPNPALAVWFVAAIVGGTGVMGPAHSATLVGISQGALVVWALDELIRGASPFRRLLGAAVLTWLLFSLFA